MAARHGGDLGAPQELASAVKDLEAGDGASAKNAITAHAGGGQASAVQLDEQFSRITTVATIGDSVKLPAAKAGMVRVVKNAAANSADCFPATGEVINALAANTALAVAGAALTIFYCAVDGTWDSK